MYIHMYIYINILTPLFLQAPAYLSTESGDAAYDLRAKTLTWHVPLVDGSSASSTIEFSAAATAADDFFPIHVTFSSPATLCQLGRPIHLISVSIHLLSI